MIRRLRIAVSVFFAVLTVLLCVLWGRNFFRKALYRVFTWAEIEPIYGKPWAESLGKAVEAHKVAARRRGK